MVVQALKAFFYGGEWFTGEQVSLPDSVAQQLIRDDVVTPAYGPQPPKIPQVLVKGNTRVGTGTMVRCIRTFWYDGFMRLIGDVWPEDNAQPLINAGNVVLAGSFPIPGPWLPVLPKQILSVSGLY